MSKPIWILYIEDNPLDIELVRDALENDQAEFKLVAVASGADFEIALAKNNFDLILSDFNILGIKGFEIIDAVHVKDPTMPVVIVTGSGSEEIAVDALKRGAADYVIKTPKHIQRLPHTIQVVLEKRRLNLARKQTETKIHRQYDELQTIYDISQQLQQLKTPQDLAETIIAILAGNLGYEYAAILLIDEASQALIPFAVSDQGGGRITSENDKAFISSHNLRVGNGIIGWVAQHGESVRTGDAQNDSRYYGVRNNIHSELCVPLHMGTRLIGAINIETTRPNAYTELDQRVLETVSSQIAIAIQNSKLFELVQAELLERKQAEEALRVREESYANLLKNLSGAVYFSRNDPDWTVEFISDGCIELTGYQPDELIESRVTSLGALIHAEDADSIWQKCQTNLAAHKACDNEYRITHRNGEMRWVRDQAQGIYSTTGELLHIEGLITDITESKFAEEKIWQSEDRYRDIVENSADLICTHDLEGIILSANPASARLLGYELDELIGKSLRDFMVPQVRGYFKYYIKRLIKHGSASGLLLMQTKEGVRRIWEYQNSVRSEGVEQPVVRGMARDVTERKQAEDEIRRLKEFNENIINTMSEGIVIQNSVGDFTFVNPATTSITGYLSEELIGKPWTKFFHTDQHEIIKEADRRRATGEASQYEIDFLHKSGEQVSLLVSGNPLFENERFTGSMAVFTDITERKRAENKIHRQIDYLTALQDIDRAIASGFDMRLSLNILISKARSLLGVDASAVLLIDLSKDTLEFAYGDGFRTNAIKTSNIKLKGSYAGKAALKQFIVKIPNIKDEPDNMMAGLLEAEGFVSYYGVPLIVKGKVIGVLEAFQRSLIKHDQEWLDFLNALAGQAAIAISNAQLFDSLQHSNTELVQAYDATIEGWSLAMDLRDKETEGHTLRVTELALRLAKLMGMSEAELVQVRRGALLHDIGKLGIPDAILLKPDKLSDEEWVSMRQHPTYAYEMLSSVDYLKPALDIPHYHHEKWDGSGYPHGLKGEEIPLSARIFAVVDVWDALTNERPYREVWSGEKALEYVRENSGTHFDPQIVEVFLRTITDGGLKNS